MSFHNRNFKQKVLCASVLAASLQISTSALAQTEDTDDTVENGMLEEVVVTGIRRSLQQSMDIKRDAGSVVDAITATDIGKLPDATIADSLQRITGIQITRSGGEGATVNIRGNGNVTTTLNGEQMLAAGSITTVTPDFADIPSTMVSGIEVMKSAQAHDVVAGLAGTINLKTNRPFMLDDGLTVVAKAEATNGSLGEETDPSFAGFLGYNNDARFGATLNLSYSESTLADYYTGSQGDGWSFNAAEASNFVQDNVDVNGDGDSNDLYYAFQGHMAGNRFIERERTGINGAIQFQLTDSLLLTGDVFYTDMDEQHYFAGFVASQAWQGETGWFTPELVSEYPNIVSTNNEDGVREYETLEGNYYTVQSASLQARNTKTHNQTWAIDKEAFNSNVEISFDNGGPLIASLRWVHGDAINNISRSVIDGYINSGSQVGAEYVGVGGERISDVNPWGYAGQQAQLPDGTPVEGSYTQIPIHIGYDESGQHWSFPEMTVEESDGSTTTETFGSSLDRYSLTSTNLYGDETSANLDVLRGDLTWELNAGPLISVDVGARYGLREVKKRGWIGGVARTNQYGDAFLSRWKDTASQAPLTGESFIPPISFTELNDRGMITQIDDFHGTTGMPSLYFVDPEVMSDPLAWHNDIYGVNIQVPDAANVYDVEEETTSAYLQANLQGELFGIPYTGNVGVRYVSTEFDVVQSEALVGDVAAFNDQEYIISGALGILQPDGNKITTVTSYSDLLPAINFAFDITPDQVVRVSATKTVSTHNTDMLAGGLTVNRILACNVQQADGSNVFCATGGSQEGNPLLEPNRNTNAEISYEWYFSDTGMFNLGLFWVQQNTGFLTTQVMRDDIVDTDGQVRGYNITTGQFTGAVPISTTVTVDESSYTRGMEVGYQQGFDFLPGFWGGFGVSANYTYSPSSSSETDYYGESLPGGGNSEHQSNLAMWYERDGWQVRVAHNYRSEMFDYTKVEGNYRFARFVAPTNYVDASISYEFNDFVKVNLQATNLTEEHREAYFQWENNVDQRYYNERRLTLGVQFNL
ncbi:TonB-dependent receptor [Gilvimarinus sp. SDUM040013]|uniref:TonB-dependent receptor n=1 Tax=Gilvimarinus gilvus TaxID=3058038 RepID=A0ABU4S5C5_9GAMM|nr:TonB-dependent receptor [Gilvimarinus sp. SDUM040013]MDO3384438.1 TonB-dependent receptor [Gilvimarinus sp. SDUM040013]MDX6851093.1 TonB-dependent receptor [Gilvimarinus sp. SDUM040013]